MISIIILKAYFISLITEIYNKPRKHPQIIVVKNLKGSATLSQNLNGF